MPDQEMLVTYRCLYEVLENQGYSNLVLKQELNRPDADGNLADRWMRSRVTARVYGTITWCITIDAILQPYLKKDLMGFDGSVRTCLRLGAWEVIFAYREQRRFIFGRVNEIVSLASEVCPRGAEKLVNAVLRRVADNEEAENTDNSEGPVLHFPEKRLDLRYSLKKEIVGCIVKWYGKDKAEKIMKAYLQTPGVTLRTNSLRNDREELLSRLKEEEITVSKDTLLPMALLLSPNDNLVAVTRSQCYKDGCFSIQSLPAMLVGIVSDPKAGWDVLDTCSAPGGKTSHLAELMQNKGHIDALDANAVRLKMVDETAERLGISIISTIHYDATYLMEENKLLLPSYDLVLCDVPCSGLGLLHRKPDIRLRMSYDLIQGLLPIQESILENSCHRVKPGGYLVYSTCTINPDENENRITAFLDAHPEFTLTAFDGLLPEAIRKNERLLDQSREGMMTILPDEEGMDGFFIAKLRRNA